MSDENVINVKLDVVNEQFVIGAMLVDAKLRTKLLRRLKADHFQTPVHSTSMLALHELERRKLEYDPATVQSMFPAVDVAYLAALAESARADGPNLEHHVESLLWDAACAQAVKGPLQALMVEMKKARDPARVRALVKAVGSTFDNYQDRRHLHDPATLVREQMIDLRERRAGRAIYPYGIPGLDAYEGGAARLVPGARPGLITIITGISGGGKSTLAARIALGLARLKRKVLFGAWEMGGGTTLELLACMSLNYSRTSFTTGIITDEQEVEIEKRMGEISRYVTFLRNPFGRHARAKNQNDTNLDLIHQYISDSGCNVFIADLWERCLQDDDPGEEKQALFRQQSIAVETQTHNILLAQQRLKDIETRPDKRPTRDGIKGSSAWVDIADTILGVHRPALFRQVPDDVLEIDILKQRYGPWPLAVECDWDADRGMISGGRTVQYDQVGSSGANEDDPVKPITGGRRR